MESDSLLDAMHDCGRFLSLYPARVELLAYLERALPDGPWTISFRATAMRLLPHDPAAILAVDDFADMELVGAHDALSGLAAGPAFQDGFAAAPTVDDILQGCVSRSCSIETSCER